MLYRQYKQQDAQCAKSAANGVSDTPYYTCIRLDRLSPLRKRSVAQISGLFSPKLYVLEP